MRFKPECATPTARRKRTISADKIECVRTPATAPTAPGHGQKPARYLTLIDPIEEWRTIPGYEGHYEVSSLGRVRSLDRYVPTTSKAKTRYDRLQKGLVLKLRSFGQPPGYAGVSLHKVLVRENRYVHRMVCTEFHGPPPLGTEVRHLNGIKTDNRAVNLAWGTHSENERDKFGHGTRQVRRSA